jgi:hypothetical protein
MLIGLGGGETWEWNANGGAWTNRTAAAPAANPTSGEIVYEGAGRFINYDGLATREWSRTTPTWRSRPLTQVGPSTRVNAFFAYNEGRGTVWMFGGLGLGTYLNPLPGSMRALPQGWTFDTTFEWRGFTAP